MELSPEQQKQVMEMKSPPMATKEQVMEQARPENRRFRGSDIDELAKASTAGMGNRKERRRRQAEFKKLMRRKS